MISIEKMQMRRAMGRCDSCGVPIHEGDTVITENSRGEQEEEFIVKYGPCGGVANVPGEVGYIGFFFESTNPRMRRNGLRTDPLYFLNNYTCKVTKTNPEPTVFALIRDQKTNKPIMVTQTFLLDIRCGCAITCGITNGENTIGMLAAESDGLDKVPLAAYPLLDCFMTYEDADAAVARAKARTKASESEEV